MPLLALSISDLATAKQGLGVKRALREEYDSVGRRGLESVEEDWETFRDAMLRCAKNVWCATRGWVQKEGLRVVEGGGQTGCCTDEKSP